MCKYVIVLLRGSFHKCYSIVNLIFQFAQFFLLDSVIKIILKFFTFILIHPVLLILYVLPDALISLSLLDPHSQHGRVERKLKE